MNQPNRETETVPLQRFDELNRLLHERPWHLRFPDKIESEFSNQQTRLHIRAVQLGCVIAVPLYLVTSMFEYIYIPETAPLTSAIRLLSVFSALSVMMLVSFTRLSQQAESLATLMTLVLSSVQLIIAKFSPPEFQQAQLLAGLLPLLYLCTVVRVSFLYASVVGLLVWLQIFIFIQWLSPLSALSSLFTLQLALALILIMLVSNYFGERMTRQRFLQGSLLQLHRQNRSAAVAISSEQKQDQDHDPVTGALSRRALEDLLHTHLSQRATPPDNGLTIIQLRVDHFDQFMGMYGEQEADFLLATIARTAQRLIRGRRGALARGSDDRLLLVLEDTPENDGASIAERLRRDVHLLGIPHRLGSEISSVTISCGVAHSTNLDNADTTTLINACEAALNIARKAGGNHCSRFQDEA